MATAAWGLGLGTCWVGNFDATKIAAMLGVPDGWTIFTVLPFGTRPQQSAAAAASESSSRDGPFRALWESCPEMKRLS
jgi:nitroreductase